jgi:hypothetical protein
MVMRITLITATILALLALLLTMRSQGAAALSGLGQILVAAVYVCTLGGLTATWMWLAKSRQATGAPDSYWSFVLSPRPSERGLVSLWFWGRAAFCCWVTGIVAIAAIYLAGRLGIME